MTNKQSIPEQSVAPGEPGEEVLEQLQTESAGSDSQAKLSEEVLEQLQTESAESNSQAELSEEVLEQPQTEPVELDVEALQAQLEDLQVKVDQHFNDLLRAQADLENARKRAQRDIENAHKFGLEKLVGEILPVKDSVELGLSAADDVQNVESLRECMELTLKMLTDALGKLGLQEVNPDGEQFDPNFHQAMTMQPSPEAEPGTVLHVVQKGYVLNERLVRPALVIVAADKEA